MFLYDAFQDKHPGAKRASVSDISKLLPVLHEGIHGVPPTQKQVFHQYSEANLAKEASRAFDELNTRRTEYWQTAYEEMFPFEIHENGDELRAGRREEPLPRSIPIPPKVALLLQTCQVLSLFKI